MQSNGLNRRMAALAVAGTLLLTTPVLAAPAAAGDSLWSGFPGWEAAWSRVVGAFGVWLGGHGESSAPDGLPTSTSGAAPASMERVIDRNGAGVDPNGSPEPTSSWTSDSIPESPSSTGTGHSSG